MLDFWYTNGVSMAMRARTRSSSRQFAGAVTIPTPGVATQNMVEQSRKKNEQRTWREVEEAVQRGDFNEEKDEGEKKNVKKQRERRKKKSTHTFSRAYTRVNTSVVYTSQLAYCVF